jgi:hypothetical protein
MFKELLTESESLTSLGNKVSKEIQRLYAVGSSGLDNHFNFIPMQNAMTFQGQEYVLKKIEKDFRKLAKKAGLKMSPMFSIGQSLYEFEFSIKSDKEYRKFLELALDFYKQKEK